MQPWDVVFLVGFVAYLVIRGVFQQRTKGTEKSIRRIDARERALLALVFVGCLLLPVVYLCTNWLRFADYRLPTYVPWAGTATMVAALWLFWRSHSDLDKNWSPNLEMRPDHQLVRDGVYRSIRHPMYAAILLFGLAQGLLLQNWLARRPSSCGSLRDGFVRFTESDMFQQVVVIGRVGQDPGRAMPSGQSVANFSIAVSEKWKDKNDEVQEHTRSGSVAMPSERPPRSPVST